MWFQQWHDHQYLQRSGMASSKWQALSKSLVTDSMIYASLGPDSLIPCVCRTQTNQYGMNHICVTFSHILIIIDLLLHYIIWKQKITSCVNGHYNSYSTIKIRQLLVKQFLQKAFLNKKIQINKYTKPSLGTPHRCHFMRIVLKETIPHLISIWYQSFIIYEVRLLTCP